MSGFELSPDRVAMIDQRIAHGHSLLRTVVQEFRRQRAEFGETAAIVSMVTMLHTSMSNIGSALDLLTVAVIELADQQERQ